MIDASLAKGLAVQYKSSLVDTYERFTEELINLGPLNAPSRKWCEKLSELLAKYPDFVLSHYFRDSKKHPMCFYAFPEFDRISIENFNEDSYNVSLRQFTRENYGRTESLPFCQVSRHALMRVFQRHQADWLNGGRLNHALVAPFMLDIVNWSIIYAILITPEVKALGGVLTPVIPTIDGVFLCKQNTNKSILISVRTYVARNQLRTEQIKAYDLLLNFYQRYRQVPLFTYLCADPALSYVASAFVCRFVGDLLERGVVFTDFLVGIEDEVKKHKVRLLILKRMRSLLESFPPSFLEAMNHEGPFARLFDDFYADAKKVISFKYNYFHPANPAS